MAAFIDKANIRSVTISENFVDPKVGAYSYVLKELKSTPWYYYAEKPVDPKQIHVLYSEKVLLDF